MKKIIKASFYVFCIGILFMGTADGACSHNRELKSNTGSSHVIHCSNCKIIIYSGPHTGGVATCTSPGVCSEPLCGYSYIPKLEHTGGVETCVKGKVCDRCNNVYTVPLGHSTGLWQKGVYKHWKVCARVGCNKNVETSVHLGGQVTCTAQAKCSVCGALYGTPLNHIMPESFLSDGESHWKLCTREGCGAFAFEKEAHYGGKATIVSKKVCSACGQEYGEFLMNGISGDEMTYNSPKLVTGMIPVKWNGSNWVSTTANDPEWYDYSTGTGKWANVTLTDGLEYYVLGGSGLTAFAKDSEIIPNKIIKNTGSMFVWMPRYTYKVLGDNNIDIKWSKGIKDHTENGFLRPQAFFYGSYTGGDENLDENFIDRDGTINELSGIWVAKFAMSMEEELDNRTGTNNYYIASKENKDVYKAGTISELYLLGKDMLYNNSLHYGLDELAESHMLKNSEWSAISYLACAYKSIPYNNISGKTGFAGETQDATSGTAYPYYTYKGMNGSTTHNVYGIYDMSGVGEFVAGYQFSPNIETNGRELTYIEEKIDVDRYVTPFSDYTAGFCNDDMISTTGSNPFIIRGGNKSEGNKAGIFSYSSSNGNKGYGFRTSILPINLTENILKEVYIEAENKIEQGSQIAIDFNFRVGTDWKFGEDINSFFASQMNISFIQETVGKTVFIDDLPFTVSSIECLTESIPNLDLINGDTCLPAGDYKIQGTVGGMRNGYPIFRAINGAKGRVVIKNTLNVIDYLSGRNIEIENSMANRISININQGETINIQPENISIYRLPYNRVVSEEELSLDGGLVKMTMEDGSYEIVDMSYKDVSVSISGNNAIVNYLGKIASFDVITDNSQNYLEVVGGGGDGMYPSDARISIFADLLPGQRFDGWIKDGSKIASTCGFIYTMGSDSEVITARYKTPTSILITTLPEKLTYKIGESIDLRGGKIMVSFEEGINEYVDMVCLDVIVTNDDGENSFNETGEKTLTVMYGGMSTTFYVTVVE